MSYKWSRNLKRRLAQGRREQFDRSLIRPTVYRPYAKRFMYDSPLFIDERGSCDQTFARGDRTNAAYIAAGHCSREESSHE
jgi:predicted helicase